MARNLSSSCKLCRREGVKLMLKGARCESSKCAFTRRPYAPGVHGTGRPPRQTDFGKQLREKQKAKRLYGISETQFANYYEKAMKTKGDSGVNLVTLLELRLDNAVYRTGFAKSRASARQLVSHGQILVNNKPVNIPSFLVKSGDILTVRENKKNKGPWKELSEELKNHVAPSWLTVEPGTLTVKVTSLPSAEELKEAFDPKLIIEFYSR
ncbi:MAG: 30S ribosomal protein S4 [Patescibacteria group bacterium]|nr:30S ribosomal protein S4 [Patescibacteria group bacterium]